MHRPDVLDISVGEDAPQLGVALDKEDGADMFLSSLSQSNPSFIRM